jgi:DNA-binding NtrC family response regulator
MTRLTRRYGVPAPHFTSALLDACQHYSWPGNLREFENFLKRFLAQGDEEAAIKELASPLGLEARNRKVDASAEGAQHEPHDGRKASLKLLARNAKGEAERQAIQQTLEETHWNRKAAARLLNISYRGLLYKIQQYHLVPPFGNGGASLEPAFRQEK